MDLFGNLIIVFSLILFIFVLYKIQAKGVSFNKRTILGLFFGIFLGFLSHFVIDLGIAKNLDISLKFFEFMGNTYLDFLKMLVIPLILTSIISSILSLGNNSGSVIRKVTLRSVFMLLVLTGISAAIGIGIGLLFNVGYGLSIPEATNMKPHVYTGIIDTICAMLPSNPIGAMVSGNTIAVAIFAILIGVSAVQLSKSNLIDKTKFKSFESFFDASFSVVKQLARIVISFTPYGSLALIASTVSSEGFDSLLGLLNYIFAMYVACIAVLVLHSIVLLLNGFNPLDYYKKSYMALLVAFTTRSSYGSLSVTEGVLKDKFKVNQVASSFVPSIGATLGMNACAGVFPAMLVVMAMHITHQPITWPIVFMVMFANAIASLGISGIPGTAYIAAGVSLSFLGLPYGVVALVYGIDSIVDMGRTAVNVNGMMTTAVVIDKGLSKSSVNKNLVKKPKEQIA
jgi:uncharacterized protein